MGEETMCQKKDPHCDGFSWSKDNMTSLIPGFSIIKSKVITPLLVATEKVVDYIISDNRQETNMEVTGCPSSDNLSASENKSLPDVFTNLSINESGRKRLKRRRCQKLERDESYDSQLAEKLNETLISQATDCIEIISKRRKINDSVTREFVTNIIDIKQSTLSKLNNDQEEEK